MVSSLKKFLLAAVAAIVIMPLGTQCVKAGDIITLDLTAVDPDVRHLFLNAEKFWEDRILAYSYEIPTLLRRRITSLELIATVQSIDGAGGVLGAAGPDATVSFFVQGQRPWEVAVRSSMFFDIDDFADLEADGILEDVIIHEMGHALGFGSLWQQNEQILPTPEDPEVIQYFGRYGIQGYAQDRNNPTVTFVPIQQPSEFVGPGTALAHWDDAPPFFNQVAAAIPKKEILTGFLCDADPNGGPGLICAPKFLSRASLGAMADLGFAVNGFNERFAAPRNELAFDPWPKQIGPGTQAALFNNMERAGGLRFNLRNSKSVLTSFKGAVGQGGPGGRGGDRNGDDPYGLRNNAWAK